jgi:hypothetical protein
MEGAELRPLSLGELLDRTFTLYRNHFWLFVGINAIPASLSIPLNVYALMRGGSPIPFGRQAPPNPFAAFTFTYIALAILLLTAHSLALGAATFAVSDAYLGHSFTVGGAYGRIRGRFWRLIGLIFNVGIRVFGIVILAFMVVVSSAGLLGGAARAGLNQSAALVVMGILVFVLMLAGMVLAIVFALRYAVSIPSMLLENITGRAAIRRSVALTRGRRWHILLAGFLASIIAYVGVIIFQGPFWLAMMFQAFKSGQLPAWTVFGISFSGAVGGSITGPLLMIVIVLLYYDMRIRKEGFDLQHMMSSLGGSEPAAGPGSTT